MTYDVTAALNAIGICVFMADIYVEPPEEMQPGLDRRPQELHRFLVHRSDGCRLATPAEKRWADCAMMLSTTMPLVSGLLCDPVTLVVKSNLTITIAFSLMSDLAEKLEVATHRS